jgi:hypothetical protein
MTLISALCATKNRRAFLPEALRCFQRQDWPDRELVVLDDGDDPVADLIPDDPLIRHAILQVFLWLEPPEEGGATVEVHEVGPVVESGQLIGWLIGAQITRRGMPRRCK